MKFSIKELSTYFNLPSDTIERWIRQGRIPIHKNGKCYHSEKTVLKKWAETHNLSFFVPEEDSPKTQETIQETLFSAMQLGGIFHQINGKTVADILKSAADKISYLKTEDKNHLLEGLIEREKLTSTGIGKGVAIPHPRTPLSNIMEQSAITTCFLNKPVNFNSIDDKPVFILFLLVSSSIKAHLHLLSRLSYCVRDSLFLEFLETSPKSDALLNKIAAFEKHLDKTDNH